MAELTDEQVTTLRGVARAAGGCFMRLPHQVRFVESFDDLAQVGFIGALKSHRRFDPARGKNYRAWLFVGAKGEIRHWLRDHARPIKRPRSVYKAFVHGEVDLTSDHISSLDVPLTGYDNPMAVGDMIPAPPDRAAHAVQPETRQPAVPPRAGIAAVVTLG